MHYFDNSATTQPSAEVMEVVQEVNKKYFANPSSAHLLGEQSQKLLNSARRQIADILNYDSSEIYFASSGTEVNNWVMQSILDSIKEYHPKRNKILISAVEHPSIMNQIPLLESRGYEIQLIPVKRDGRVDLDYLKKNIDKTVLLVSTMAVNNEVGSVQPLPAIAALLQDYPQIIWHVDGVQAVATQLNILLESRIDMLTLSSHKYHAVRGAGILAKRERVAAQPLLYGGGQENNLRSSTENLSAVVAASKALRLAEEGQEAAKRKLGPFRISILDKLKREGWETLADQTASEHIICAAFPPTPGEVLLHAFEEYDIYLSTTSACSSKKHAPHASLRAMGIKDEVSQSAVRISMSSMTSQEEVDHLIAAIKKVSEKFK